VSLKYVGESDYLDVLYSKKIKSTIKYGGVIYLFLL